MRARIVQFLIFIPLILVSCLSPNQERDAVVDDYLGLSSAPDPNFDEKSIRDDREARLLSQQNYLQREITDPSLEDSVEL